MAKTAKIKKPRWRTIRCIIEYRTPSDMSERDLAHHIQSVLDTTPSATLIDSKLWAKQFTSALARMDGARPKRLRAATRALAAVIKRLRKL